MHAMTMRPPSVKSSMNASAAASTATAQQQPERHLLQNEGNCKLHSSASCIQTKAFVELPPQQLQQSQQQQQQQHIKIPPKSREIIVENQYNFAESRPTKPSTSFQYHFEVDGRGGGIVSSPHHEDSIQLLDLSTSPPTHDDTVHVTDDSQPLSFLQRNSTGRAYPRPPTQTSHGLNGGKSSSQRSSVLSSSSSEDEPAATANRSSSSSSSAALYDDAAEHFIITYPAETPRYDTASEADNCLAGLPLSEKEPLLQSSERSDPEEQPTHPARSLCLNKNSASLIFTRKDLSGSSAARYILPTPTPPPNNNSEVIAAPVVRRSYHQSLRAAGTAERATRKQTKHLPASYLQQQAQPKHPEKIHLQQRRSLQLNYNNNNNLVTSTTASANFVAGPAGVLGQTNNNNCCGLNAKKSAQIAAAACNQPLKGPQQQQLHSGVTAQQPNTAATSRKQHAYSWYAPVYSALEEELEQDSRDSSPIHNLANTKKQQHSKHYQQQQQQHRSTIIPTSGSRSLLDNQEPLGNTATTADNETVALLETRKHISIQGPLGKGDRIPHLRRPHSVSGGVQVQVPTSLPLHNGSGLSSGSDGGGGGCGSDSSGGGGAAPPADEGSLGLAGSQLPPRRRLGNFLKSLVGGRKRNSSGSLGGSGHGINTTAPAISSTTVPAAAAAAPPIPASPEITITRTPSEQNMGVLHDAFGRYPKDYAQYHHGDGKLTNGYRSGGSTSSLNVVHQKLINMMRREGSAASLHQEKSQSIVQYTNGMRKCETVLALTRQTQSLCSPVYGPIGPMLPGHGAAHLTHSSGSGVFNAHGVEQIRPLNRLRNSVTSMNATCSRCSSLLSLAASGSRYSLNIATGAYSLNTAYAAASRPSMAAHRSSANVSAANSGLCRSASADEEPSSYLQPPPQQHTDQVDHGHDANESRKSPAGLAALAIAPATTSSTSISPPPPLAANHHPQATLSLQQPTCPSSVMMTSTSGNSSPTTITAPTPTATTSNSNLCSLLMPPAAAAAAAAATSLPAAPTESPPDVVPAQPFETFTCKLCLIDVETAGEATTLQQCGCQFCTECMRAYVEFEICEAAYEISCPDAQCPAQGIITPPEIATLTTANLMKKHHRYRLNREIDLDKTRTWCPRAGCETVCHVGPPLDITGPSTSSTTPVIMQQQPHSPSASDGITAPLLCAVQCPSCKDEFCSACKKTWHPNMTCEENGRRLTADGQDDIGIPFDNDLIKCCPMCAVPIEKDEGCAQMMCKRCKHVFCWYCLASLDDDFLLRHYDKGPCKNKLGHSRASVVWHRAQVIGIFAGFGILLLVASPLLLLAAPCIICCKCRSCSGSKIDDVDGELDEAAALQS